HAAAPCCSAAARCSSGERLGQGSVHVHQQVLEADRADLEPIRECLGKICGEALTDAVLGLVAAIPISPRPLTIADRGPLAVLARRRADIDAKLLLACALLPDEAAPEIVGGPEQQSWISIVRGGTRELWSLDGPNARRIDGEPARKTVVLFDPKP
ncbi:MAG: hypothetical protein HC927_13935, partial [Deltaproteobacteria bacterium]|nr:hypothetical protein [Deltaproteobacteria bacterium]